jgi:hypothetical protein
VLLSKLKKFYKKEDWRWLVQVYMAATMALNLMFLFCDPSKKYIAQHFYDLDINLFSVEF